MKRLSSTWIQRLIALGSVGSLLLLGQQCSNVNLEEFRSYSLSSYKAENPFLLEPPSEYVPQRRYVLLVDMSNSMISGQCAQDVDANLLYSSTTNFTVWDPNKNAGIPDDHRGSGVDCKVIPSFPILQSSITTLLPNLLSTPPTFFQTSLGVDHEGDRFKIIQSWFDDAARLSTPAMRENLKFLLIPVTGGNSQTKIMSAMTKAVPGSGGFLRLSDPALQSALNFLKNEQQRNLDVTQSDDLVRYQSTTMGTSALGDRMRPTFNLIREDMKDLYTKGLLSLGEYEFVVFTDGKLTPIRDHLSKVLSTFQQCAICASDPQSCKVSTTSSTSTTEYANRRLDGGTSGQTTVDVCSLLVQKLEKAWGSPESNTTTQIDFYIGLIQSLPEYFGAGDVRVDLVQLKKQRFLDLNPGSTSILDTLESLIKARQHSVNLWQADDATPPFNPPGTENSSMSMKMTHFFILNPNGRLDSNGKLMLDSDGDGVFDDNEIVLGTDPTLSRSDGFCLDSLKANSTFAVKCKSLSESKSCDPTLDSDGDSLNECEEAILGTDPYDFDSDSDGLPDSLELIYGFNPLTNDSNIDANGDGMPNAVHFSHGVGPNLPLSQVPKDRRTIYEVNSKGKQKIIDLTLGEVWVELSQVIVRQIPLLKTRAALFSNQVPLYTARAGLYPGLEAANAISEEHQLISISDRTGNNQVLAIGRMIDLDNPRRAYWRVLKWNMYYNSIIKDANVDLSAFHQIRALDRN